MPDSEALIREPVTNWTRAIEKGDRPGILAHHAPDLLIFDFPDTVRGIDAYDKTWQFFDDSRRGTVTCEPRDVQVTAGEDVASASCEIHCDGTTGGSFDFRLTVCLEKRGDEWVVKHERHSVPTKDDTLIGPDSKKRQEEAQ